MRQKTLFSVILTGIMNSVVLVSANTECKALLEINPDAEIRPSPMGEWFVRELIVENNSLPVIFFHGGWGKISAAASAQYVIDRWSPDVLINLGTCGGFEGEIDRGTIVLVDRTVVYDIIEQMGDPTEALKYYATEIDLSFLGEDYPTAVQRGLIVSGDRDLIADEIPRLKAEYRASVGDWESGSIAWVAQRNNTRCLILRGVTDLVGEKGGEAYDGNLDLYVTGTKTVMSRLVESLPGWLAIIDL